MADEITLTKELIGLEDLLVGAGTVNQVRSGVPLAITKLNITFDTDGKAILGGTLNFASIPTSSVGLVAGDVWSNAGVLTIV